MQHSRAGRYSCLGLLLGAVVCAGLFAEIFLADLGEHAARRAHATIEEDFERIEEASRLYGRRHGGRLAPTLEELLGWTPQDPWDRPYRYATDAARRTGRVLTLGRDGEPGGEAGDADLALELAGTRRDGR